MQDQGGITIEDGALIGHNVVLATLNHDQSPDKRGDLIPAPIHIGRNVWIGSNSTMINQHNKISCLVQTGDIFDGIH